MSFGLVKNAAEIAEDFELPLEMKQEAAMKSFEQHMQAGLYRKALKIAVKVQASRRDGSGRRKEDILSPKHQGIECQKSCLPLVVLTQAEEQEFRQISRHSPSWACTEPVQSPPLPPKILLVCSRVFGLEPDIVMAQLESITR